MFWHYRLRAPASRMRLNIRSIASCVAAGSGRPDFFRKFKSANGSNEVFWQALHAEVYSGCLSNSFKTNESTGPVLCSPVRASWHDRFVKGESPADSADANDF
jgi:hypothetical protein